ncbi:MAG: hypothetical protein VW268_15560 [Rhodospirillaceae bacterium]
MNSVTGSYRLITRPDYDGVVCGALFKEQDIIDTVLFAHPRKLQHGERAVSENEITANLPYVDGVHLCFDLHISKTERSGPMENHIIDPKAPSAARVVYDHYGGGGHAAVGTCQVDPDNAEKVCKEIIEKVRGA